LVAAACECKHGRIGPQDGEQRHIARPVMTKPTNADLARELVAAKAHIAELEAARPDHIEQPAVDLTVARRSYLALVPKPAAEAWAELVTIAKHMGFDLPRRRATRTEIVLRRSR
jgi:hypothetical protein